MKLNGQKNGKLRRLPQPRRPGRGGNGALACLGRAHPHIRRRLLSRKTRINTITVIAPAAAAHHIHTGTDRISSATHNTAPNTPSNSSAATVSRFRLLRIERPNGKPPKSCDVVVSASILSGEKRPSRASDFS